MSQVAEGCGSRNSDYEWRHAGASIGTRRKARRGRKRGEERKDGRGEMAAAMAGKQRN